MDTSTPEARAVAASVSALLRDRAITHEDAAERTGIPYRTLRRRLSGVGKGFDIDELAKIARLLDIDVAALITYAEAAA
jgi:predicted transcriptional regulator